MTNGCKVVCCDAVQGGKNSYFLKGRTGKKEVPSDSFLYCLPWLSSVYVCSMSQLSIGPHTSSTRIHTNRSHTEWNWVPFFSIFGRIIHLSWDANRWDVDLPILIPTNNHVGNADAIHNTSASFDGKCQLPIEIIFSFFIIARPILNLDIE